MSAVVARHHTALQAGVDRFWDATKRQQDERDAADAALEQRIAAEVERMAGRASDDPAYCARIVNEAEINLHELRVRLHGESMTWERAVFDLLHMAARRDDPEAIAVAAELLRAEVGSAISSDAAVYGMAATTVAMGEDN
ncbi:MAG: hypothetical protein LC121_01755 [Anaerolineae bacterium]|nr:hypothetical protein [Anaerolineae bacterium]